MTDYASICHEISQLIIQEQNVFLGGSEQMWMDLEAAQVKEGIDFIPVPVSDSIMDRYTTIFKAVREISQIFEELSKTAGQ